MNRCITPQPRNPTFTKFLLREVLYRLEMLPQPPTALATREQTVTGRYEPIRRY